MSDHVMKETPIFLDWTTPEVTQEANETPVPTKSREKYLAAWENFMCWKKTKKDEKLTENLFLEYFNMLANKYKPNTLWSIFSMLKSMVKDKNGIDIKKYSKLLDFLRGRSEGYTSRKCKVLSSSDVERFLNEAPDNQYLATKVALIFAVTGACRREDLRNITTKDIKDDGQTLQVTVHTRTKKKPRTFIIDGPCYTIVKKYTALRSKNTEKTLFFQQYLKGRCTVQPIGVNKFGKMPMEIAKFLGLPDAESYTGHTFTRTSLALWADSDTEITFRSHGAKRKYQRKMNKLEPVAKKSDVETLPSTSYISVSVPPLAASPTKDEHNTSTIYIKQELEQPCSNNMSIVKNNDDLLSPSKINNQIGDHKDMHTTSTIYIKQEIGQPSSNNMSIVKNNASLISAPLINSEIIHNKDTHTTSTIYIKQEIGQPSSNNISIVKNNDDLNKVVVGSPVTIKMELDDNASYNPSFPTEIKIEKTEIG